MKADEILSAIRALALSQGAYRRLLSSIESVSEETRKNILDYLESQNFKDVVDMVMFFEA